MKLLEVSESQYNKTPLGADNNKIKLSIFVAEW